MQGTYAEYADPGPAAPLQLDVVDFGTPEEVMGGRNFVPSRAATPEPHSPRSRPVELRSPPSRTPPPQYEPYPASSSSTTRRRNRPAGNKRSMNAFLIYRREFPQRYPHIDQLERHQGPKSSIIGAMWRAEPMEVKEQFFRLQAEADAEFRKAHGTLDAPRADPIKTLMRRERARQTRPRDEKLAPRSELIVKLWREKKTVEEFVKAVTEYDEQCQLAEKSECSSKVRTSGNASPLSNHTNTPMDEDVIAPLPSTPVLQIQTAVPSIFPVTPGLTEPASSPVPSPVVCTPPDSPGPSTTIAVQDHGAVLGFGSEHLDSVYKPESSELAEYFNFNALLDLALADQPVDPQPIVNDDLITQYFQPSSLVCPPELSTLGVNLEELLAASGIGDSFFLDQNVGLDQGFAFGDSSGIFPLGTEDDLLGLSPYNNDNTMPSVDNLVDCYIEMSCLPP